MRTFTVKRDPLDGGYVAECPELPGAVAQGETKQEALDNVATAVVLLTEARRYEADLRRLAKT